MNRMPFVLRFVVGMSCVLLTGCGGSDDGLQRIVVSGAVTFRGAPVEDGQIRFIPQGGTPGPVTIEAVRHGRYRCDRKGGVTIGTHRVEILSYQPDDPEPKGPGEPGRRQLLPEKYNKKSQLTFTADRSANPSTENFDLN